MIELEHVEVATVSNLLSDALDRWSERQVAQALLLRALRLVDNYASRSVAATIASGSATVEHST